MIEKIKNLKKKKSLLCKLGLHHFKEFTETVGYIDFGDTVIKHEESWIGCTREGCNVIKEKRKGNWVEFKKME